MGSARRRPLHSAPDLSAVVPPAARCLHGEPRGGSLRLCWLGSGQVSADVDLGGSEAVLLSACAEAHVFCRLRGCSTHLSCGRLCLHQGPGCGLGLRTLWAGSAAFLKQRSVSRAVPAGQPAKTVEKLQGDLGAVVKGVAQLGVAGQRPRPERFLEQDQWRLRLCLLGCSIPSLFSTGKTPVCHTSASGPEKAVLIWCGKSEIMDEEPSSAVYTKNLWSIIFRSQRSHQEKTRPQINLGDTASVQKRNVTV
ncbi:uncharacterized protein LOC126062205 [Elephas maximus indicus]|uniref:uncharacterized protein LOC126062205 n=1 Tax=Elephas maximus indicus TaxID=99487 RepID=UPI002116E18E|nr:uncharacterized protein LOC126062205 [Elephas maximus indicus]